MGSLESGLSLKKRDHLLLRSTSATNRNERHAFGQKPRSRFERFVLFKKIDYYLQWICTVAVFFFFVVLFQMFLPGSVQESERLYEDLTFLKEIGGLDFGEGIKFEPSKLLSKFQKDDEDLNVSFDSRKGVKFGSRKPQLAMVFVDLRVDPQQILMVTVATALQEIGYEIEVYTLKDGPAHAVWRKTGVTVNIIESSGKTEIFLDWLNYDGILVNSLEARGILSHLMQEPFESVPLVWTINERTLATRLRHYASNGQVELVDDWKRIFSRATVVVFPNYVLPMLYSACDSGNYFVIPGSPAEAWEVENYMVLYKDDIRAKMDYGPDDFVIAIVGTQFLYRGLWLEHALVLQALLPLFEDYPSDNYSNSHLKIIILSGEFTTSNYSVAVEAVTRNLRYPRGIVKHVAVDEDSDSVLSMADLVIYGSFLEEQLFPEILHKAMCFGKPIIAPDLLVIRKYDRTDQPQGMWEEVYRSVRRADRSNNNLHERDDGELERTGQLLCIYEPYFGEGTWPFLHHTSLYRGLGLSTKGRRPGADDIDGPSHLPLLDNPYYRDALGEYGAFFAIANRIDRIHKNAWIGFQSWRATARKESLSKAAEHALLEAIQGRRHGDALYFWVRVDMDPRNPLQQDFWSFCDSINAGNCKFAFSEALKRMYGIKRHLNSLPPMPVDGSTWSIMHSWVLPTRSFLEFVMFSRMFVDALDAQVYDEHHQTGHCYLSLSMDKHCYSRVLELLINVWAYHSARRMVYINPKTGLMQEHHKLKSRRGQLWVKWFSYATLKSMDEDLAEESDSDHPRRARWLWPSTGEVFWRGLYEKERNLRNQEKEKRRQESKDKIARMRKRVRQETIGKYVKPPPEEVEDSNSTVIEARVLR